MLLGENGSRKRSDINRPGRVDFEESALVRSSLNWVDRGRYAGRTWVLCGTGWGGVFLNPFELNFLMFYATLLFFEICLHNSNFVAQHFSTYFFLNIGET